MKTLSASAYLSDRHGCTTIGMNALLAVVLTILSFRYVEPKNCYRTCGESLEGKACPTGGCPIGEQKAGWPLPVFIDAPGGGSPTGGWGLLGPEDIPVPVPLLLDVLFYSSVLWLVMYIIQVAWKQALRLVLTSLPVNVILALCLWLFYMIFGSSLPLGRGQSLPVYIDTPEGRGAESAFSPRVSIPVEELVQNYGDPDQVWLDSERIAGMSNLRTVLYWNSMGMFVELPEIQSKTYSVEKTTKVKLIIFPQETTLIGLDEKPVGEKKIPWTGYGSYQP